jgi:hypothetical protein
VLVILQTSGLPSGLLPVRCAACGAEIGPRRRAGVPAGRSINGNIGIGAPSGRTTSGLVATGPGTVSGNILFAGAVKDAITNTTVTGSPAATPTCRRTSTTSTRFPPRQFVCGLNPAGPADDTVLVARIVADGGGAIADVVNYACHPTTLAWDNTAISPDYVGALRETVERYSGVPCLFLQGASGDLGPREGFVGDPAVADRNGRRLAFASLAALESLPPPGTHYVYQGPTVSGAVLGVWRHEPLEQRLRESQARWDCQQWTLDLPYRADLPAAEEVRRQQARWQAEEARAREERDLVAARDCRARVEQMTRWLARLGEIPPGVAFPLPVTLWRLGDAVWLFVPGEQYQALQTSLRARFPGRPIVVVTLTGGWLPGYVPPAAAYGKGIYQESIALVAPGCAEALLEEVASRIGSPAEQADG